MELFNHACFHLGSRDVQGSSEYHQPQAVLGTIVDFEGVFKFAQAYHTPKKNHQCSSLKQLCSLTLVETLPKGKPSKCSTTCIDTTYMYIPTNDKKTTLELPPIDNSYSDYCSQIPKPTGLFPCLTVATSAHLLVNMKQHKTTETHCNPPLRYPLSMATDFHLAFLLALFFTTSQSSLVPVRCGDIKCHAHCVLPAEKTAT